MQQDLICILGPTASGKTGAAVALAKRMNGEVLSADSVQVYRGMDIGSAKPTPEEMQGIPHHMIDCMDIDSPGFSVSAFFEMASLCIKEIQSRGKQVILAGGSGLYVNSLTRPLNFAIPADEGIREKLEKLYDLDRQRAYEQLFQVDPSTASRLHPNDKKRIVRALEVFEAGGKPLSAYGNDFQNTRENPPPFTSFRFCLTMDRALLYERINRRVDFMMEAGLLQEARRIFDAGYDPYLPAMQSIGYQQLFAHFRGTCTLDEAVEQIKMDTRRFAKRQFTWFRRDPNLVWIDVTEHCGDSEWIAEQIVKELDHISEDIHGTSHLG